jgi:hypothetical protein
MHTLPPPGFTLNKVPLCQYLYLGLLGVLTKHLCPVTSIEWGRMCKHDDLDNGLPMPKLAKRVMLFHQRQEELGSEKEDFRYGGQTKK